MFLLPQKQKWKPFFEIDNTVLYFVARTRTFMLLWQWNFFQVFFSVLHRPFQRENYQVESINHVRFVHAIGNIKG